MSEERLRKSWKYDFSEIRGLRFECQDSCGKCCFPQALPLSTSEINKIKEYIRTKPHEELESFVFDLMTYNKNLQSIDTEKIEKHIESIKYFWSPFQLDETEDAYIVRNYIIHTMPISGRCQLLNPIDLKCFIHPVRPRACRLYPLVIVPNTSKTIKIRLGTENCPGVNIGPLLDTETILKDLQKTDTATIKDIKAYMKYISDNEITLVKIDSGKHKDRNLKSKSKKKRYIEPFAELGLISRNPSIEIWNKQFFE